MNKVVLNPKTGCKVSVHISLGKKNLTIILKTEEILF